MMRKIDLQMRSLSIKMIVYTLFFNVSCMSSEAIRLSKREASNQSDDIVPLPNGQGIDPNNYNEMITKACLGPGIEFSNLLRNLNPQCSTGETYALRPVSEIKFREAIQRDENPDFNIYIRGFDCEQAVSSLGSIGGPIDRNAPRAYTALNRDKSQVKISHTYKVRDWNWNSNTRGNWLSARGLGLQTIKDQLVHTPMTTSAYRPGGMQAFVLHATPTSIALKYTQEDNVVFGYTIHLTGLCVDSNLIQLYKQNLAGTNRVYLSPFQVVGKSLGREVQIYIRDTGSFMTPIHANHWWQNL